MLVSQGQTIWITNSFSKGTAIIKSSDVKSRKLFPRLLLARLLLGRSRKWLNVIRRRPGCQVSRRFDPVDYPCRGLTQLELVIPILSQLPTGRCLLYPATVVKERSPTDDPHR